MNKMRWNTTLLYGFLFAFVLSFVFEGRVYYQLAGKMNYDVSGQNMITMFCQLVGLICGVLFIKQHIIARKTMGICILSCVVIAPLFLIPQTLIRTIVMGLVAGLSGLAVACWGSFYKYCVPAMQRLKTMADTLILANVLMIIAGIVSTFVSAIEGFILVLCYLMIAVYFLWKGKGTEPIEEAKCQLGARDDSIRELRSSMRKAMSLFVLFIIVITINSGLMYGVVQTEYQSLELLVSWYWAVPYILTLFIMRNVASAKSSSVYIYVAIGMIVVGFVAFMFFDISNISYLIIDSLLLGASGILDLFWSSIVGETMEYSDRPVRTLGIAWSANVMGVLMGSMISQIAIENVWSKSTVTVVALVVACGSLMLAPEMLRYLRMLLKNHMYLSVYIEAPEERKKQITEQLMPLAELTAREKEILNLVLQGKSNKVIAKELCISENTVKTHIRNILGKYEVQNRTQLISEIMQKNVGF